MLLTVSELGALFLLLFALFYYLGIFATIRAVLAFLGVVAIGTSGWIGRILTDLATWAQDAVGTATGWVIGSSLAFGLFIIVAVILGHDLHPKNGARKRTGWLAVAAGAMVVAGVVGIPALSGLRDAIMNGLGSAVSVVNSASGR